MTAQLELGVDPIPEWVPPPTTRWCLVGEPGRRPYLLSEHSPDRDAQAVGVPEPTRARDHEWLSPDGIGTSTDFGDGIAGFVWFLSMEADRAEAHRRASRARSGR